jgi:hypothetical protein
MRTTTETVEINNQFMAHQKTCRVCSSYAGLCDVGNELIRLFNAVIANAAREL